MEYKWATCYELLVTSIHVSVFKWNLSNRDTVYYFCLILFLNEDFISAFVHCFEHICSCMYSYIH